MVISIKPRDHLRYFAIVHNSGSDALLQEWMDESLFAEQRNEDNNCKITQWAEQQGPVTVISVNMPFYTGDRFD